MPFTLAEIDDPDVRNYPNYWSDLLDSCKEVISNNTTVMNLFHEKYKAVYTTSQKVISTNFYISQKEASSHIRRQSRLIATSMNICRTQFKANIPIIQETFIEAFSLFKYFSNNFHKCIPIGIKQLIYGGLSELSLQIQSSYDLFVESEKI